MGGISSAIGAAQRSLGTFSQALNVIQNNIANAATPGYARQRASLASVSLPRGGPPQGVELQRVQTLRDDLLEFQAFSAKQAQSQLQEKVGFFRLIEPNFRLDGAGSVGDSIDGFFASVSALSVNPNDLNLRAAVKGAADGLASSFRSVSNDLDGQKNSLDGQARAVVRRINAVVKDIAELQARRNVPDPTFSNSAVETQQNQKLTELSELVGFTLQTQRDGTLSVIAGSTSLLTGVNAREITVTLSNDSIRVIDQNGNDITSTLEGQGGQLGAILEARNQILPGYRQEVAKLGKSVADNVNEQLARGVDLNGASGLPLFDYQTSFAEGSGRTAGTVGNATLAPPAAVTVDFSGGITGSITATLDGFFVGAPPGAASAGDTVSVSFTSADGGVERTITTAPLLGGETSAELAARLNDQIALDPQLSGLVSFGDAAGALKVSLSDQAGQGFSFTSSTSNPGFSSGLEAGGTIGGQSADEIAAALNVEVANDPGLSAAGVRFSAVGGELRLDADIQFDYAVTDDDTAGAGFASGLDSATGTAGGADAGATLSVSNIGLAQIASGTPGNPSGNENLLTVARLCQAPLLGGVSFTDYYSGLVNDLGGDSQTASAQLATQDQLTVTAERLRDDLSGVDINEEAVELLRFEQAFRALLRVIQVLDDLANQVLAIGGR